MTKQSYLLPAALRGLVFIAASAICLPAHSLEFEVGDWLLDLDTTLGYAAQWRTESRDRDMALNLNGNDGNINFDSGSMTSSKASFIVEFVGEYKDFSFFLRGDGLYDYVYADGSSDLSRENFPMYNSGTAVGGTVNRGDYPRETIEEHGRRLRLLDAFAIYNFNLGDQGGSVKLGRQVISWGEATFYPGVNAIQNPIDGGVAQAPGTEAKEIFLPTSAIDLKWDFTPQLEW